MKCLPAGTVTGMSNTVCVGGAWIFCCCSAQLDLAASGGVDRVLVRFRSAKGNQSGDGVVCTRKRAGTPLPLRGCGGAVDLVVEPLSSCLFLTPHGAVGGVQYGVGALVHCDTISGPPRHYATWWRWRDCQQQSIHCTPFVLGAPPFCRRGKLQLT